MSARPASIGINGTTTTINGFINIYDKTTTTVQLWKQRQPCSSENNDNRAALKTTTTVQLWKHDNMANKIKRELRIFLRPSRSQT